MACRDGVHHDQEDIRRPRRRQGPGTLSRLLDPVAHPERSPQDRHDRAATGKLIRTNRRKAATVALMSGTSRAASPAPRPTRPDCRSGERQPEGRVRGQSRPGARVNSQRPRRGQTSDNATPEQSQRQERRRRSKPGSARRSGGSSCRDDPDRTPACGATIVPTSSKPATSPHQAERTRTEMSPSRIFGQV